MQCQISESQGKNILNASSPCVRGQDTYSIVYTLHMIYTYFPFFPTSKLTGGYPISTATVLDGLDGQNLRAFSALSMRLTISTPSCELGCQSFSYGSRGPETLMIKMMTYPSNMVIFQFATLNNQRIPRVN